MRQTSMSSICAKKSAWCSNSRIRFLFRSMTTWHTVCGLAKSSQKTLSISASKKAWKQAAVWDEVKDDLHKSALAFSGGQQQRICIARVLAVHPKVILMDEPTSALDPISSSKIEDTLLKLKNDYSIIIVTHNMQQASRISDRTALLLNGDLIEYDRTEEMFLRPKEKITDDYLNGRFG